MLWAIIIAAFLVFVFMETGFLIGLLYDNELPALLFLSTVMLSGLIAGSKSGLMATMLSLLVIMYFFTPPKHSLVIDSPVHLLRLSLFVAEGVFLSFLIDFLHLSRKKALIKAEVLILRDQELRDAHQKTIDILSSITDIFFTLDHKWCFTYLNKQAENFFRAKNKDLIGKNIWDTFPDMVNSDFYTHFKNAKKNKKSNSFEIFYDPLNSWLNVNVYPLKDGLSIYVNDETQQKLAEESLRETENKMMLLTKSPFIGIAFAEEGGNIVYGNDAYLQIIGRDHKEVEQRRVNWKDITPEDWFPADQKASLETKMLGSCSPYEKEYLRPDGSRVPVLVSLITYGKNQENALVFVMDITKRKELERQKEELLAEVSHELKTPVAGIKAYEQLLTKRFQKKRDYSTVNILLKIEEQINKITRFINDLLDATRLDSGQTEFILENFSIDKMVKEVIESIQTTTKHRISIYGLSGNNVNADKTRTGQVLTNLLVNAIKYSPEASKIDVSVRNENESVKVCVKDFGIGIPKNKRSSIFQRLSRITPGAHPHIEGIGLGLYISAQIIKRLGGQIWFTSRVGVGSTFCFSLPISKNLDN